MYGLQDSKPLMNRLQNLLKAAELTLDDLTYIHPYLVSHLHGWGRKTHYLAMELLEKQGKEFGRWRDDTKGGCAMQLTYYVNHRDEIRRLVDEENEELGISNKPAARVDDSFRREAALRIYCALINCPTKIFYHGRIISGLNGDLVGIAIEQADALIDRLEEK